LSCHTESHVEPKSQELLFFIVSRSGKIVNWNIQPSHEVDCVNFCLCHEHALTGAVQKSTSRERALEKFRVDEVVSFKLTVYKSNSFVFGRPHDAAFEAAIFERDVLDVRKPVPSFVVKCTIGKYDVLNISSPGIDGDPLGSYCSFAVLRLCPWKILDIILSSNFKIAFRIWESARCTAAFRVLRVARSPRCRS